MTEFDQSGQVHFEFSESLQPLDFFSDLGINLTSVNEDIKDIIFVKYRCAGDDQPKIPELVSWVVKELTSDRLTLSLNFTNRLYISSFGERDKIDFSFLGQFLFQAQTDGHMLDPGFKIIGVLVPP